MSSGKWLRIPCPTSDAERKRGKDVRRIRGRKTKKLKNYLQLTAVDVDRKSVVGSEEQMSWIDFRWLVG